MRTHRTTVMLAAAAALGLTGCGDPIDRLDADAPREARDEAYTSYMEEQHPDADVPGWVDFNLRLCSVMNDETVHPGDFDDLFEERGVTTEDLPTVRDVVYQGVRVYCPENLPTVEHFRPVGS